MRDSTASTREAGSVLVQERELAGLTGAQLAKKLGWSPSKVCRLEYGEGKFSEVAITAYLAHCGVTAAGAAEVFRLVDSRQQGFLARRDIMRNFVLHESTAEDIFVNATLLVPGLLQTEDYARATISSYTALSADEVERRVDVRMDRQEILKRQVKPSLKVTIMESVLRIPFGGRRVMHEQLLHLVFASDRPQLDIHVVPTQASCRAAAQSYFTLMSFSDHGSVIFVDGGMGSMLIEDQASIAEAAMAAEVIVADALDVRESREVLARIASEYD